jgi:hypothetical protein
MRGELHGHGLGELEALGLGPEVECFEPIGLDIDLAHDDQAACFTLRLALVADRRFSV